MGNIVESGVPVPVHVDKAKPKGDVSPDFVEATVCFMVVSNQISMGSIAERSISRVLAVAQLVVSAFANIKLDRATSSHSRIACSITCRIGKAQSARAPTVHFSLLQVGIIGEPAYVIYVPYLE